MAIGRVLEWERKDRGGGRDVQLRGAGGRNGLRLATRDGRTAGGGVKMLSAQQTLTRREMHGL